MDSSSTVGLVRLLLPVVDPFVSDEFSNVVVSSEPYVVGAGRGVMMRLRWLDDDNKRNRVYKVVMYVDKCICCCFRGVVQQPRFPASPKQK